MKKYFVLMRIIFHIGQSKESDFFNFYKGGNNYKKPVKYVLLMFPQEILKEIDNKIYFIWQEKRLF
jgi:hypothetical protein